MSSENESPETNRSNALIEMLNVYIGKITRKDLMRLNQLVRVALAERIKDAESTYLRDNQFGRKEHAQSMLEWLWLFGWLMDVTATLTHAIQGGVIVKIELTPDASYVRTPGVTIVPGDGVVTGASEPPTPLELIGRAVVATQNLAEMKSGMRGVVCEVSGRSASSPMVSGRGELYAIEFLNDDGEKKFIRVGASALDNTGPLVFVDTRMDRK
jgi:hypothetical protein